MRRLPVVLDTGELRGMITQGDIRGADLLRIAGLDPVDIADALRRIKVYEVMNDRPIAVTLGTGLREAAMLMIENKTVFWICRMFGTSAEDEGLKW